ncbi:MAG: ribosome-associated translation inhibitor RaiA [Alphaproteobacteria bacterium]
MKITTTGKQITVTDRLREYVEKSLTSTVSKYFDDIISANVSFSKEGDNVKADITVHPRRGIVLQGSSTSSDLNAALDNANEKIATRLRRYKNRLVDQKSRSAEIESAYHSIIAAENSEEELPVEGSPITIAELEAEIPSCTVSGAVMRMDLADMPALLFRNNSHGGINMVYRRKDGNIGWVDPQSERNKQA